MKVESFETVLQQNMEDYDKTGPSSLPFDLKLDIADELMNLANSYETDIETLVDILNIVKESSEASYNYSEEVDTTLFEKEGFVR